jgi:hypothetical protein
MIANYLQILKLDDSLVLVHFKLGCSYKEIKKYALHEDAKAQVDFTAVTELQKKADNLNPVLFPFDIPYTLQTSMDRTAFLSILLESFMGTNFDDIVKDYMLLFVENSEYALSDHKNGSMFIVNFR